MVPTVAKAPFDRHGWIFELQYDGFRAIVGKRDSEMCMLSRKGRNMLPSFPEIRACLETLPDIVLDGELVVLDEFGRAQFDPLRRRLSMRDPKSIGHVTKVTPAAVFAFDLVALRGRDLRALPLLTRKEMLKGVLKDSTRIRYTPHVGENGVRLYQMAAELGIEGIVAKRADSVYRRGGRTFDWIKIKTPRGRAIDEERKKWNE